MKRVAFVPLLVWVVNIGLAATPTEVSRQTQQPTTPPAPPGVVRPVEVVNFPDVQNVAGTVNVGNLPAVQTVTGAVNVSNLPVVQQVAGQVAVTNLPATQSVSGSVTVDNLPTVQTVAGTVEVSNLSDLQFASIELTNLPLSASGHVQMELSSVRNEFIDLLNAPVVLDGSGVFEWFSEPFDSAAFTRVLVRSVTQTGSQGLTSCQLHWQLWDGEPFLVVQGYGPWNST